MSRVEQGESLHKTNSGWYVSLENKINELKMMGKSIFWIFGASLLTVFVTAFITSQIGLYHSKLPEGFYFDFLKLSFHSILNGDKKELWEKSLSAMTSDLFWMFLWHSIFGFATGYYLFKTTGKYSEEMSKTKFISGTPLVLEDKRLSELKILHAKGEFDFRFKIGRIPLPFTSECNSVVIVAASGGGKSVLLSAILLQIGKMNHVKGIIHDNKPEWDISCYRPDRGDLIFNPMDARNLEGYGGGWTVYNDIHDIADLMNFAKWIVPHNPAAKDQFWDDSARGILESILLKLWEDGDTTNAAIRYAINLQSDDLSKFLEGYPGAEYAAKKDSLSTLKVKMKWIQFLKDGEFSIGKWVNEAPRGLIFLSNTEKTQALFSPLLTLFVNAMGSFVLNLPDDRNRRFFFFLDEFTALGRLDKVIDLLKLGRSKGSSVWLAFQDMQAAQKIYGQEDFATIVNNCKNIAVGQIIEPKAALYFSQKFGKQIFYEMSTTKSIGVGDNRDGQSFQEARKEDFVVKDADLLNLKEREFFVKINGFEGVTKTMADIQDMPKIAEGFIPFNLTKEEQIAMVRASKKASVDKKAERIEEEELEEEIDEQEILRSSDENEYGY